jgi:hypothetical protein
VSISTGKNSAHSAFISYLLSGGKFDAIWKSGVSDHIQGGKRRLQTPKFAAHAFKAKPDVTAEEEGRSASPAAGPPLFTEPAA